MAFSPKKGCAALLLALWLGLMICVPVPGASSAAETEASPTQNPAEAETTPKGAISSDQLTGAEASAASLYSIAVEGQTAENLTKRCVLSTDLKSADYIQLILSDDDLYTSQRMAAGKHISLSWTDDVPVKALWIAFKDYPGEYRVQQFDAEDALIREEAGFKYVNHAVFLEGNARSVTVIADEKIEICSLYAYGEGIIPSYHPWEPAPEKLDYLIVVMHPDDDVLFMGAILPLYTVDQGREGNIFYAATRQRERKDEAGNGAWIMGLRKTPILENFLNISRFTDENKQYFQKQEVVKYLVGLFRRYRPEVVFSHDLLGEYGNWQHRLLARAVRDAVPLAADPSYDAKSAEQYGTWEVKKLYLHLYEENPIHLPVTKPIEAYGGSTPVEIATAAFQCHQSQLTSRHQMLNEGVYSLSDFGLAYTTVGLDTPDLNDPFEHIDPTTLHSLSTPAPTDTPVTTDTPAPTQTPSPTDTPAATDTPAPTKAPTEAPAATEVPASTASPAEDERKAAPSRLPIYIGLGAALCLVVLFLAKARWLRIFLGAVALLLCLGAILLSVGCASPSVDAPAPTAPVASPSPVVLVAATQAPPQESVHELSFTTETLPGPEALANYTELKTLDLTACEQVDAALYEAIRRAVPANCRILWSVPLTDGRFPADSASLTLPRFSAEDAALLPYFTDLAALDASGSTAYDALLELAAARPELSLTYTLPVGDQVLTMGDEALTAAGAPDFALLKKMLGAFPSLKILDLTGADASPADAVALAADYPDLSVLYTVPVGSSRFPMDAVSLDLAGSGIESAEALLDALPYLPNVMQVDLHGTKLMLDDLITILAARPGLALSHTVDLLGQSVETDVGELDLRNADRSVSELIPLLRPFTSLQKVYLPQTDDVDTAGAQLWAEHPETVFVYQVTAFGQTLDSTVEELDVSKKKFASVDAAREEIAKLPYLKKLVMCDCKLSNEQMEELLAAFPRIKFVWTIKVGPHKLRTDAVGFSTKNPSKHTSPNHTESYNRLIKSTKRLYKGDLKQLKYCTDLVALDVGHNYLENEDLEVLQYLPHLQILILADNKITDISALHQLKELKYVELFMNRIPDVSPLVGLENLVDINIAYIHLSDITPLLSFTQAERLWFSLNNLTKEQCQTVVDALPNTLCNYTAKSSTAEGWREHERYFWMRSFFN